MMGKRQVPWFFAQWFIVPVVLFAQGKAPDHWKAAHFFPEYTGNYWTYLIVTADGKQEKFKHSISLNYYNSEERMQFIDRNYYSVVGMEEKLVKVESFTFVNGALFKLGEKDPQTKKETLFKRPVKKLPAAVKLDLRWIHNDDRGKIYYRINAFPEIDFGGKKTRALYIRVSTKFKKEHQAGAFVEDRYYVPDVGLVKKIVKDKDGKIVYSQALVDYKIRLDPYFIHYRDGRDWFDKKKYTAAKETFAKAHKIRNIPQLIFIETLYRLAKEKEKAGDISQALVCYDQGILHLQDVQEGNKEKWRDLLEDDKWALVRKMKASEMKAIEHTLRTRLAEERIAAIAILKKEIARDSKIMEEAVFWSGLTGLIAVSSGIGAYFLWQRNLLLKTEFNELSHKYRLAVTGDSAETYYGLMQGKWNELMWGNLMAAGAFGLTAGIVVFDIINIAHIAGREHQLNQKKKKLRRLQDMRISLYGDPAMTAGVFSLDFRF